MIELDQVVIGSAVSPPPARNQSVTEMVMAPSPPRKPLPPLEPLQRKQVPWSVRLLNGVAWACFAVAWVAAFAAGAVGLAWLMEAGGAVGYFPVAFLVYGGVFSFLSAKLRF